MVGPHAQGIDGGAHRLVGGAQDVDRIDLHRIHNSHRPCDGIARGQVAINFLAPFRQELLRIVEPPVSELLGKDDRRRYDWPGQRAASRFIDAGNRGDAERTQSAFMAETTATIH